MVALVHGCCVGITHRLSTDCGPRSTHHATVPPRRHGSGEVCQPATGMVALHAARRTPRSRRRCQLFQLCCAMKHIEMVAIPAAWGGRGAWQKGRGRAGVEGRGALRRSLFACNEPGVLLGPWWVGRATRTTTARGTI